ncbi:MAG: polyprenyl synthetase family protein [Candidatus Thermoplasmatota archaeon]|nr:polyprenyl synthetase family protein [Candidatus Thermoplasmatota archaeon]
MDGMNELMDEVNEAITGYLSEKEPKKLYDAVKYLPSAGGKRLRPIIAMLACEAVGGERKKAIPFGVALEITHTFTLVHDDIMDKDEERRGMPSVHKKFGEATAILAGDALFAKAFEIVTETEDDPDMVKTLVKNLSVTSREICEGQQMDMSFEEMEEVDEQDFLLMVEKKTAKMFEYAAYGGAIIGNGSPQEIKALKMYGRNLGMAFQVWDDCLDIIGKDIGKPVGSDIREGKRTLVFLHALKNSPNRNRLLQLYGKKDASDDEVNDVIKIFKDSGSLDYAKDKAIKFSMDARENLGELKDSDAKAMLTEIAKFAVEREK